MRYRPTRLMRLIRFLVRSAEANGVRGAFVEFCQHVFRSIGSRGVGGTLKNTFRDSPSLSSAPVPEQLHPFDLLHGTDTGGRVSPANLSAVSLAVFYSNVYAGVPPSVLTQALASLSLQYEDYTFVDLGCGKGRALMVAAQFPFRHLLGVEIASDLCEIAQANIAKNPEWEARISIVNQDATKVNYPEGPLLLFLYSPFRAPVLRRVLYSLERQLQLSPRPTYILYGMNPRFPKMEKSFDFLSELSETSYLLSQEDADHDPLEQAEAYMTLYAANIHG